MAKVKIEATANLKNEDGTLKEALVVSHDFDFGENLKEAVKLFGEEVIFSMYKQQATITLQSRMRAIACNAEKGPKKLAEELKDWKPGVISRQKKSDAEKLADFFKGKSPEEIQAMLAGAKKVNAEEAKEEKAA